MKAWVIKRKRKNGTVYWAVAWRDIDGTQRMKSIGSKALAEEFALTQDRRLRVGLPGSGVEKMDALIDRWLVEHVDVRCEESTRISYRQKWRYLQPYLGHRLPRDIGVKTVEGSLKEVRDRTSPSTANGCRRMLSAAYTQLVRWGDVDPRLNPMPYVQGFKVPRKSIRIYTMEEVHQVVAHLPELRDRLIVLLAAWTGIRRGELFALRWGDVGEKYIIVHRALTPSMGFKMPKNGSAREVPVASPLHRLLVEHREASKWTGDEDLVFTNVNGRGLIDPGNWTTRVLKPAAAAAGLPGFKLHSLRHTFASWLISRQANEVVMCQWLGHSSPNVTRGIYGHLMQADVDRLVAELSERA